MNFRALFSAGLILSLAGFTLNIFYYNFQYSVLGYGLILTAFIFKRIEPLDWVWMTLIASIAMAVLLNQNPWAFVFESVFVMAFGAYHLVISENIVAKISSGVSIFLSVASVFLMIALLLGFARAGKILDIVVIAMILTVSVEVIANKKWV